MHILGTIFTLIGVVSLILGCVMSLKRMQKLQDLRYKQTHPQEYKKLKSNFLSIIITGVGIILFILGFVFLNFM